MVGENHFEHVVRLARGIGIIHFASLARSAPRFEPIENGIFDGIGDEEISIWIVMPDIKTIQEFINPDIHLLEFIAESITQVDYGQSIPGTHPVQEHLVEPRPPH